MLKHVTIKPVKIRNQYFNSRNTVTILRKILRIEENWLLKITR